MFYAILAYFVIFYYCGFVASYIIDVLHGSMEQNSDYP